MNLSMFFKISGSVNTKRNKSVIVELQHITRKRFIPMTQFTTELLNFIAQKQDIDEFFRLSLETAMNNLLQAELSAFLGYELYEKVGYNSSNSRNGTYSRKVETKYGTV
jgi:transposase, mutator family|nr:transposase [Streptococcus parasanguinis]